jgi:hypothetical protein
VAEVPSIDDWVRTFIAHHDSMSSVRQRAISNIILIANVGLALLFAAATNIWGWRFAFGPTGIIVFSVTWTISLLCLILCSSLFAALSSAVEGLSTRPEAKRGQENPYLSGARKFFYYPGVFANIIAVAVVVEQSGGLIHSPFTAVLFAMVLAGQQLGRYRTNSSLFIVGGVVLTLLLLAYEGLEGIRVAQEPPRQLLFFILAASFLVAALFTHIEKRPNYRATGKFPPPTRVEIYSDNNGTWRYALYCDRSPLDPVLEYENPVHTVQEAKDLLKDKLTSIAAHAGLKEPIIEWVPSRSEKEAYGVFNSSS